ncbi:hypothetical protein DV515_00001674 [Chloebia gouldiae]|uniref:Uncharacterized protein n=1 Tax=Chloebia gouldiae TaxID=44316 RepID=A0A3L8SYN2_CHLGU|nr:hypothetical protein DV515_00001674 [Chloebia gouldiae]
MEIPMRSSLVLLSIVLKEVKNEAEKPPVNTRSNGIAEVRMCYETAEQPHRREYDLAEHGIVQRKRNNSKASTLKHSGFHLAWCL